MAKNKKTTPKSKFGDKTVLSFKIGEQDILNGSETRNVYLDGKVIYVVDCTKLAGICMRDQTKDVMAAISKEIGREIDKEEFKRIKMFDQVEIYKKEDK